MAFCRWLTERLGYEIRLQTEWEWQQAATGGNPKNKYPWGPDWNSNRTNTYDSGLDRTTAVGLYPHGASPAGAFDMSGNVSEWCLNESENPQPVEMTGYSRRAARGRSWVIFQDNALCAIRYDFKPHERYDYLGFRLLCASPIF